MRIRSCVGGMLCIAAYFQARGVALLVGDELASDLALAPRAPVAGAAAKRTAPSGDDVLARNAFDSSAGPLSSSSAEHSTAVRATNAADPYADPACETARADVVTAGERGWSFASLATNDEHKLRRIGDKLGPYTVEHIGYYDSRGAWELTPRVWLRDGDRRCLVEMGAPGVGTAAGAPDAPPARLRGQADPGPTIRKIGEHRFEIDESAVEPLVHDCLLRGHSGAKPCKVLTELGWKKGDVLRAINGFDVKDRDRLVDAYAAVRRTRTLEIAATRGGAPRVIELQISRP